MLPFELLSQGNSSEAHAARQIKTKHVQQKAVEVKPEWLDPKPRTFAVETLEQTRQPEVKEIKDITPPDQVAGLITERLKTYDIPTEEQSTTVEDAAKGGKIIKVHTFIVRLRIGLSQHGLVDYLNEVRSRIEAELPNLKGQHVQVILDHELPAEKAKWEDAVVAEWKSFFTKGVKNCTLLSPKSISISISKRLNGAIERARVWLTERYNEKGDKAPNPFQKTFYAAMLSLLNHPWRIGSGPVALAILSLIPTNAWAFLQFAAVNYLWFTAAPAVIFFVGYVLYNLSKEYPVRALPVAAGSDSSELKDDKDALVVEKPGKPEEPNKGKARLANLATFFMVAAVILFALYAIPPMATFLQYKVLGFGGAAGLPGNSGWLATLLTSTAWQTWVSVAGWIAGPLFLGWIINQAIKNTFKRDDTDSYRTSYGKFVLFLSYVGSALVNYAWFAFIFLVVAKAALAIASFASGSAYLALAISTILVAGPVLLWALAKPVQFTTKWVFYFSGRLANGSINVKEYLKAGWVYAKNWVLVRLGIITVQVKADAPSDKPESQPQEKAPLLSSGGESDDKAKEGKEQPKPAGDAEAAKAKSLAQARGDAIEKEYYADRNSYEYQLGNFQKTIAFGTTVITAVVGLFFSLISNVMKMGNSLANFVVTGQFEGNQGVLEQAADGINFNLEPVSPYTVIVSGAPNLDPPLYLSEANNVQFHSERFMFTQDKGNEFDSFSRESVANSARTDGRIDSGTSYAI